MNENGLNEKESQEFKQLLFDAKIVKKTSDNKIALTTFGCMCAVGMIIGSMNAIPKILYKALKESFKKDV